MGIFFRSQQPEGPVREALVQALVRPQMAQAAADVEADQTAHQLAGNVTEKFAWGRFLACLAVLAVIVALVIYTAHDEKLADLYKALLHLFEILAGVLVGLITGEKTGKN
jgi:uncharacterized membrane protein